MNRSQRSRTPYWWWSFQLCWWYNSEWDPCQNPHHRQYPVQGPIHQGHQYLLGKINNHVCTQTMFHTRDVVINCQSLALLSIPSTRVSSVSWENKQSRCDTSQEEWQSIRCGSIFWTDLSTWSTAKNFNSKLTRKWLSIPFVDIWSTKILIEMLLWNWKQNKLDRHKMHKQKEVLLWNLECEI
jgi:hypothetical protein